MIRARRGERRGVPGSESGGHKRVGESQVDRARSVGPREGEAGVNTGGV